MSSRAGVEGTSAGPGEGAAVRSEGAETVRAVVLAMHVDTNAGPLALTALRFVVDRPVLQHLVEYLVQQGVREVEVVACERPGEIRAALGDGRRWGVRVRYHLSRDASRPVPALRRAMRGAHGRVVIAAGDSLVPVKLGDGSPAAVVAPPPEGGGSRAPEWGGLACVSPTTAGEMPSSLDETGLGQWLIAAGQARGSVVGARTSLSTRTARAWVRAQRQALEGALPGLQIDGRLRAPGVWIGRGARVHGEARLSAPVWIGEEARIERGVVLGPGAVVGARAIIESDAQLEDALVLPGTYIGKDIELKKVVAEPGKLTHAGLGITVPVADGFLVGPVSSPPRTRSLVGDLVSRVTAAVLFAAGMPLFMLGITGRPSSSAPALPPRPSLADLLGRVWPGLWAVARGERRLVGVTPRGPQQLAALPEAWRETCTAATPGLITEPMVQLEADAPPEAVAAADALYALSRNPKRDAWLVRRYVELALVASLGLARSSRTAAVEHPSGGVASTAKG